MIHINTVRSFFVTKQEPSDDNNMFFKLEVPWTEPWTATRATLAANVANAK